MAGAETGLAVSRPQVGPATVEVLNRGGWANPDVLLLELADGRRVVVKDYRPRGLLLRSTFGRWVLHREARAYRKLAGVRGVPVLLGQVDSLALVIEYRPGRILSRSLAGELPEGFVAELHEMVGEMHARGVVHLDLRHRSNVLAGHDGHPVLIDFASAVFARPNGVVARCLRRVDALALRKWTRKLSPREGTSPEAS